MYFLLPLKKLSLSILLLQVFTSLKSREIVEGRGRGRS
jgi:hypothetical protein